MTILDAFAVIALLKGEPAAPGVQLLIRAGECALTTLGVPEVVDHLIRVVGTTDEDAVLDVAQLGLVRPLSSRMPVPPRRPCYGLATTTRRTGP